MTIAGVAVMQSTSWVPPGYSAAYNAVSRTVEITTPGCVITYKADPAVPPAGLEFPTSAAPPLPGSATVEYVEVSSPSCPAECASGGYNVAWDATGSSARAQFRGSGLHSVHACCATDFVPRHISQAPIPHPAHHSQASYETASCRAKRSQ